jgi:hypothetical protein
VNLQHCERESQILQAIRCGDASSDLIAHAQTCPVCSEVWLVAQFLQEETNLAAHEVNALPDPGLLWRKAQARAREQALVKATWPIRMMRTCAIVLAIFAMPWLLSPLSRVPGWLHELGFGRFSVNQLWPIQSWANQDWLNHYLINQSWVSQGWVNQTWLDHNWLGAFTGATLVGISVTLACIAVGSWYMLREK